MPTEINWPIFSSSDIFFSSLAAQFSASFEGLREYGFVFWSGSGFGIASRGAPARDSGARVSAASISKQTNDVINFGFIEIIFNSLVTQPRQSSSWLISSG